MAEPSVPAAESDVRTPNPKLARIIIGAVLAGQALYAGVSILGGGPAGTGTAGGASPTGLLGVLVMVAFVGYVAAIAVYLVGTLGAPRWLRPLAMGIAAGGLAIAAVRVLSGHPLDDLLFGMGIDGLLLYGLGRPDIRRLYPV